MRNLAVFLAVTLLMPLAARAADQADLEGTQILGSRELPKVLYIVPWKSPQPTELVGRPASSLMDEVMAPVDRDVFERQVNYHAMQNGSAGKAAK